MLTSTHLIEIETKVLQQDILLEELNQVIYRQQRQIDHLEISLAGLAKRFRDATTTDTENEIRPHDERPPHY
jgi:SlyX protein